MIEARNLTKYYGAFPAVRDISFKVANGQIVGFLGPNGAGKTTVLRMLTGFTPPSSGSASVAGYDVTAQGIEARARVGYLPESVPLYRDMTVAAYLKYFARLRGVNRARVKPRVQEVLGLCRLENFAGVPIGQLSKGYRQLTGLAQAIVHEPDVLILDEPTVGIDPRQVVEIRRLIKDLGLSHTIILSSHILAEVSQLCQRVIIIDQGQIKAVDTPSALAARFQKVQRVSIEAQGNADAITAALSRVPGVSSVQVITQKDRQLFKVSCRLDRDPRQALAEAVMTCAGASLLGLSTEEMSLEEIFLQLTGPEARSK